MNKKLTEVFARTKILCTLGPATQDTESIKKLILAGMDGVRLNFSHGNKDFYKKVYYSIKEACAEENTSLAVLVDLQGPKIRIGDLEKDEIEIKSGDQIEITIDEVKGSDKIISTSYKNLISDASAGDMVMIDDGLIRLKIIDKKNNSVVCKIINGGILHPRKGMNLPGMKLSTPSITEKDYENLEFIMKYRADYIALSFVRSANDIIELRDWLKERNFERPIIAKIEKKEGVDNFDEILQEADGIMIARGDLGVELPPQDVPVIQKEIIKKCNTVGKIVITATQMLESMIHNPIPTRAEASDVANAVWDGTDVVMLSGETSVGKFPVKTTETMNDLVRIAEQHLIPKPDLDYLIPSETDENLFDSFNRAVVSISKQINAAAIVAFTYKGRTAINISKFRPKAKIIAFSNSMEAMNILALRWGATSFFFKELDKEHLAIEDVKKIILESGHVKPGDTVIFTAGAPYSEKSRNNWIRFEIM